MNKLLLFGLTLLLMSCVQGSEPVGKETTGSMEKWPGKLVTIGIYEYESGYHMRVFKYTYEGQDYIVVDTQNGLSITPHVGL